MQPNGRHSEHKTTRHCPLYRSSFLGSHNCRDSALAANRVNGGPIERSDADSRALSRSFNRPALRERRLAAICVPLRPSDSIFEVMESMIPSFSIEQLYISWAQFP
jgi:hypothetical protein